MVQYRHPDYPLGGVGDIGSLQVSGQLPFPFVPAILKPDFHLCLCEMEGSRQTRSFRTAQVPLHVKGGLKLEDLASAEHSAGLLLAG